jgi:hypothetical protein
MNSNPRDLKNIALLTLEHHNQRCEEFYGVGGKQDTRPP